MDGTGKLAMSLTFNRGFYSNAFPGVIQLDPWLEPHRDVLKHRFQVVETWAKTINETEGGLDKFSKVN
jgi:1,4-alpha-glucan branching enzyme